MGLFQSCSRLAPVIPLLGPAPIPPGKGVPPEAKDNIQEAYKNYALASLAMSEGNYEGAKKYLSVAIENDPQSIYLCTKMALFLKALKAYPEALAYALKCLDADPKDLKNLMLVADLYALMGDDELAIEQYNKILSIDPENQRTKLLITTILVRKGEFQEALHHLEGLIKQRPDMVIAHYYRGKINLEMGRYQEAEDALLETLRLNNGLEPALFDLGTLYQATDRHKEAVEIYEKLLAFYPDNMAVRERIVDLYFKLDLKDKAEQQMQEIKEHSEPGEPGRQSLGLLYLRQGKLDESIEELNLIVSAWPDDDKSRYYLAAAYKKKGEDESALEHFNLVSPESKYFINAQMNIAFLLDTQERYDEAITVLKKAIALEKGKIELYLMLASIYEAKEEYENAIAVIKDGQQQDENDINLLFRLGVIFDKRGEKAACVEQMKRVLEINPDHADALNFIGYTYAEQGIKLDEAIDLIQKALKFKPESGYIIDSLGWVYFQKGLYDKALRHLEKAISLTPDDPTINEHLGDAHRKKNNYQKALEHYKKALSFKHPKEEELKEKITELERLLEKK